MKILLLLIGVMLLSISIAKADINYVDGYYRSSGTYVSGHYRDTSNDGRADTNRKAVWGY